MADEIIRSWATLSEMIKDRAKHNPMYAECVVDQISDVELMSLANRQTFVIDLSEKVKVIYNMAPKLKFSELKKMLTDDNVMYIVVIKEKMSGTNAKSADNLKNCQQFDIKELLFNVSRHTLVPVHEVITGEKIIDDILEKNMIKSRINLPWILKSDAMARYLDLAPGDIVKITRPSPSAGKTVLFRCCV